MNTLRHTFFGKLLVLSLGLFALVGLFFPQQTYALAYDCEAYSNGAYNETCETTPDNPPPVTPPVTPTVTPALPSVISRSPTPPPASDVDAPQQDTEVPQGKSITLNDYDTYASSSGITLDTVPGQVLYLTVNGLPHSITIKLMTSEYVIVTIASTPQDVRINKGETVFYDVDGDKKEDVAIAFSTFKDTSGVINFKQISQAAIAENQQVTATNTFPIWVWVVVGAVIAGIITLLIVIFRKKKA